MRNPFWRGAFRHPSVHPSRPGGRSRTLGLDLPLEPRVAPSNSKVADTSPAVLSAPAMAGLADLDPRIAGAAVRAWQVAPGTQTAKFMVILPAGVAPTGLIGLGATVTPYPLWANAYVAEFRQARSVAGFPADIAAAGGAAWYYPLIARQQTPRLTNDPQVINQWHLKNTGQGGGLVGADANVEPAWNAGYDGTGSTIAIVDDGLLRTHQDLIDNYDAANSFDFNDNDPDPTPVSGDTHGTAVAGVSAAQGDNGIGVAGAAYNATVTGIRLIADPTTDEQEALALSFHVDANDIFNNSWGPDDNGIQAGPGPAVLAAFSNNFVNGRNGKGTIYTWAAGNGLQSNDNVNYDGYANVRQVIAVGAITNQGVQSFYSEPGASMLVTAYSNGGSRGITTTSGPNVNSYTASFGGTSSASPLVSGVIALMLEANPDLTARDVQHILVDTAEKVHSGDPGWTVNGAGRPVNHKYGFGGIDARAAVEAAEDWVSVGPEVSATSGFVTLAQPIADGTGTGSSPVYGDPVVAQVDFTADLQVEHVEVVFSATHASRGHLEVVLTSPDGTRSVLAEAHNDPGDDYTSWVFMSVRHWGERSAGTWTLQVRDGFSGTTGTVDGWQLVVHGVAPQPPVLAGVGTTPVRYLENVPAATVPTLTAADPDSPNLAGASVAITTGFNAAEDRLLFANQNGITGNYVAATGVLTLTGTATVSQYQAALRSVQYDNLSQNPAAVSRTITVTVSDPESETSNTVSRPVDVVALNDAPSFTAGPNVVLLQDSGPTLVSPWATNLSPGPAAEAGQTVTLELVSNSASALFSAGPVFTPAGNLFFTPAARANGVATIQVRARDNGGTADGGIDASAPQTFTITLTPRPTVVPDSYTTDEDVALIVGGLGVAANDISPNSLPLTASVVVPPAHGTLVLNPDGSFSYTPVAHYHGSDSFTYTVSDGALDSVPGPVTIQVKSVNDVPVATDDAAATPGGRALFLNLLGNDSDADGDPLTILTFTTAAHGRLTRSGSGLLYTPTAGYQGADEFTYTVSDGKGGKDTGTVTLSVTDATPPKVQAVRLRYGPNASRVLDLAGLARGTLSWDSISRIEITFSEGVAVAVGALTLTGPTGPVSLTPSQSADGRVATWTVPGTGLPPGRYTIRLSAAGVSDLSPNANPLTRDYARTFAVLPGDFDGNGIVNAKDLTGIKRRYTTNPAKVNAFADLNADGVVDKLDTEMAISRLNSRLA